MKLFFCFEKQIGARRIDQYGIKRSASEPIGSNVDHKEIY
jgi:hypothetical protein